MTRFVLNMTGSDKYVLIGPRLKKSGEAHTKSHLKSFIKLEVPHLRLFLMLSMMPLKRCVATESVLTVLLENEVWFKLLM